MPHIVFKGKVKELKFDKFEYNEGSFSFKIVEIYRGKYHFKVFLEVLLGDGRKFVVEVRDKKNGVIIKVGDPFFIERDFVVKRAIWEIYKNISGGEILRTNIDKKITDG